MKEVHSPIKKDILLRVRLLYVLFIAVAAVVLLRLIWVQLFSESSPGLPKSKAAW